MIQKINSSKNNTPHFTGSLNYNEAEMTKLFAKYPDLRASLDEFGKKVAGQTRDTLTVTVREMSKAEVRFIKAIGAKYPENLKLTFADVVGGLRKASGFYFNPEKGAKVNAQYLWQTLVSSVSSHVKNA